MNIELPIKIHNKFLIEVKDIVTGKIVQKGYAENIILDNLFSGQNLINSSSSSSVYAGNAISYGKGTGTLSSSRTTLFNRIGSKTVTDVEFVANEPPLASYSTKKITIAPSEHIGETITEVGISTGSSTTIHTHAFIKDSEGNPLALEPKTDTQEITIYRTVYFRPNFDNGVELESPYTDNNLIKIGTMHGNVYRLYLNSELSSNKNSLSPSISMPIVSLVNGVADLGEKIIPVASANGKINFIGHKVYSSTMLNFNLRMFAENNSSIWNGYEFDKIEVGVGNGSQKIFNLTWDEVWMEKPKAVFVDGVEQLTGVTFNAGDITFDTAPADQSTITADYWVKYMPKDTNHIAKIRIIYTFGEGVPA